KGGITQDCSKTPAIATIDEFRFQQQVEKVLVGLVLPLLQSSVQVRHPLLTSFRSRNITERFSHFFERGDNCSCKNLEEQG
ncbi:MAG: hypothetical protein EZS28_019944, partial [Streblomastix strix]